MGPLRSGQSERPVAERVPVAIAETENLRVRNRVPERRERRHRQCHRRYLSRHRHAVGGPLPVAHGHVRLRKPDAARHRAGQPPYRLHDRREARYRRYAVFGLWRRSLSQPDPGVAVADDQAHQPLRFDMRPREVDRHDHLGDCARRHRYRRYRRLRNDLRPFLYFRRIGPREHLRTDRSRDRQSEADAVRQAMSRLRGIRRDDSGATIVEFAIILVPMVILLMGGIELGYNSYVRSVLQGSLNDAARRAAVEAPAINASGSTVEEKVENLIRGTVRKVSPNATVNVTQQSYFDFSNIGNPEKLMTDHNSNGQFDAADGDCWEDANGNGQFDTDAGKTGQGGAEDVVHYVADVSAPRLFPLHAFIPTINPTIEFELQAAVRNQPFGQQANAAVICA
ncbi:MAG TPA: hypothetical protein DD795_00900 [Erythrobacter sp.]|nr:hypothetical protein [Erythrobacter sp.]